MGNSKIEEVASHARYLTRPKELLARVIEQYLTNQNGWKRSPVWRVRHAPMETLSWLQQGEFEAIVPHVGAYVQHLGRGSRRSKLELLMQEPGPDEESGRKWMAEQLGLKMELIPKGEVGR